MNVSIQTAEGLKVYRELIEKETSSPARWAQTFGVDVQLKGVPKERLVRVNDFEAAVNLPMPKTLQLFAIQRERIRAQRESRAWERSNLPQFSTIPISQPSVDIWKDAAYKQRPNAERRPRPMSAPVTFSQGPPHRCDTTRKAIERRHSCRSHASALPAVLRPSQLWRSRSCSALADL